MRLQQTSSINLKSVFVLAVPFSFFQREGVRQDSLSRRFGREDELAVGLFSEEL
jgi:hypothetical protein